MKKNLFEDQQVEHFAIVIASWKPASLRRWGADARGGHRPAAAFCRD